MKYLLIALSVATLFTSAVFAQEKKASPFLTAAEATANMTEEQAKEEFAYAIGVQAFVWGHPLVTMYRTAAGATSGPNPSGTNAPYNQLGHARGLVDHRWKSGTYPNSDTQYSLAWLDLAKGPLVLTMPDTKGRYHVAQFSDAYNEVFAALGSRTTGTKGGRFVVVGPRYDGTLPEGLQVLHSPTNLVWLLIRTLISGTEEIEVVHAIQDGYTLQSLSSFVAGEPAGAPKGFAAGTPPFVLPAFPDGVAFFRELDRILQTEEIPVEDRGMADLFALVGLGPDADLETKLTDPAIRKGLERAAVAADAILKERASRMGFKINGWQILFDAGRAPDILWRGALTRISGQGANLREDALYPLGFVDRNGEPYTGRKHYVLRFEKNQTPPVNGFWSLSMYGKDENPVDNSLERYSIGDRTKGLKYAEDGSLTIYIQAERPPEDQVSNWLPAPPEGFILHMRAYWPKKPILDRTYQWPPVMEVK